MKLIKLLRREWDRSAAWACIGGGLLVMLLGWLGVSRTTFPAEQIPYVISGGLFALFLLGLGAMLWLSADMRDEWRKLDAIERNSPLASTPRLSAVDGAAEAIQR